MCREVVMSNTERHHTSSSAQSKKIRNFKELQISCDFSFRRDDKKLYFGLVLDKNKL